MRFGGDKAAKTATACVLGVADRSRPRDLAPQLARIGARVGLREVRSTNPSSSMVDGAGPGGRINVAGPAVSATSDEISSSFDFEHEFLGFGETYVVPKPNKQSGILMGYTHV